LEASQRFSALERCAPSFRFLREIGTYRIIETARIILGFTEFVKNDSERLKKYLMANSTLESTLEYTHITYLFILVGIIQYLYFSLSIYQRTVQ